MPNSRDQLVMGLLFVGRHLLDVALADATSTDGSVTGAETAVMLAVLAFPASSQSEIATILGRDKTTLSRTVSRLENEGFLFGRMDPVDGRRKSLELTERGRAIVVPALESVRMRVDQATAELTSAEEIACLKLVRGLMADLLVV